MDLDDPKDIIRTAPEGFVLIGTLKTCTAALRSLEGRFQSGVERTHLHVSHGALGAVFTVDKSKRLTLGD